MTKNFKLVGAALIAVVIALIYASLIYGPITGTVVDAETGKPIEGAVVLVEWTKTKGMPGLTHTESYKVFEAISDNEGKVKIEGCYSPFVKAPIVTVYKRGYVAWNNRIIFPDYRNRADFMWSNRTFRLENFKQEYSYIEHTSFIHSAINLGFGDKKLIAEASYWEELEASKERDRRRSH